MKITSSILSIPPYISTSWKNVLSIHLHPSESDSHDLVITLTNDSTIVVPELDTQTIELVFKAHASHLEQDQSAKPAESRPFPSLPFPPTGSASLSFGIPIKMKEMEGFNSFSGMMQHNPDQANFPPLPEEMLNKVQTVSKMVGLEKQLDQIPKAEPHCNCPYCQVARALHGETMKTEPVISKEEAVCDADLTFREWDLKEIDKHLYEVSNPLDQNEKFQVYLGTPIGCTCGSKNCEHIKAVLNS